MYHGISSGRLPAQIIRNCEKEKYAQTITSASKNLPRSCKCLGVRISDIGARNESSTMRVIRNAIDVNPWLARNSRPNIVENHFGFTDSTQSIDMKVTLKH